MFPKKYGDKIAAEVSGPDGGPIQEATRGSSIGRSRGPRFLGGAAPAVCPRPSANRVRSQAPEFGARWRRSAAGSTLLTTVSSRRHVPELTMALTALALLAAALAGCAVPASRAVGIDPAVTLCSE